MATCNPFKVGDKVRLKKSSYDFNPTLWREYDGYTYSVVTGVFDSRISTSEDSRPQHYTHFEFYKEEKDMTQQTQQKTKRVPFSKELWYAHKKTKVIWNPSETEILYFARWPSGESEFIGVYKAPMAEYRASIFCGMDYSNMSLEIPITTKRIPFNPELKDAKVVCKHTSDELLEWAYMNTSGVICGVIKHECGGYVTGTYHPNTLEMEIEEDV